MWQEQMGEEGEGGTGVPWVVVVVVEWGCRPGKLWAAVPRGQEGESGEEEVGEEERVKEGVWRRGVKWREMREREVWRRKVRGCEGGRSGKVGEGGEEGGKGRGEGERGDEGEKRGDKNVQCAPRRVTAYNRWHSRNRGRWGRRGYRFNQVLLLVQMRSY